MASKTTSGKAIQYVLDEKKLEEASRETLHLNKSQAAELVERLYGFKVESVRRLDSYGDHNFHVKVADFGQEHHGFVLKVMNAEDSRDEEQIIAQTSMIIFLESRGFHTQRLEQNRWGNVMSMETFTREENGVQVSTDHNVRLLTYLPGILACDVTLQPPSVMAAGVYMARIHTAFKDFDHPGLDRPNFKWNLRNLGAIRQYLHVLNSEQDREMVSTVLDLFADKVVSRLEHLPQGPTHADFHDANILVREETSSEVQYQICGLLDFGDAVWNPFVFDVAITVLSLMLTAPDNPTAYSGHFLTGYESIRPLTEAEQDVLYYCVLGRACQWYVLNEHAIRVNPDRESYIRRGCVHLYRTLKFLVQTPKHDIDKQWLERGKVS